MTHATTIDLNPFEPEHVVDPYAYHATLRDAGPIVWLGAINTFAAGRFAEVSAILNDPHNFVSSHGVGHADITKEGAWRPPSLLLETDPPFHDRARKLMNRIVSPKAVKLARERWAAEADELVAHLVARGTFDAATDLGEGFPLQVFPDTIGMRQDGRENLLPYAAAIFNTMGPPNALAKQSAASSRSAVAWVEASCKRDMLDPDGWGMDVYRAADRGECTLDEAERLVRSFLSAGVDTTVNGISHLMLALARFPDQWEKLRQQPQLARKAFEESLRWNSTVQILFRTAARDIEVAGVTIPAGAKILLSLGSANSDPRRWADPARFDIDRQTSGHVGFGFGVHQCLGQMVARMEGEVVLAALVKYVRTITLAGEPVRRANNTMHCMASLPISVEPASVPAELEAA